MISQGQKARSILLLGLFGALGCGTSGVDQTEGLIVEPPEQCSEARPDCSASLDFPTDSDLDATNSAGIRYSAESGGLVIDRESPLPDEDGDGVPDDADDCPGTPDWISCDGDPTNDGIYATVFYNPAGDDESRRRRIASTVSDMPRVDVYFLVDATPTLTEEIAILQSEILTIIDEVRMLYDDARFGVGLYRAYPLDGLADQYSQAPYHHVLDLTDDEALVATAINTLNTLANSTPETAATQALFTVATGQGLGRMVPNRAECPNAEDDGYPCFRTEALRLVVNITDSEVYNGPDPMGAEYPAPPFAAGEAQGGILRPPVEMFPALFDADDAANALDLGDLSARSLTVMGMSTLLTNQVNSSVAPGCAAPPPPPPTGADMDDKDVVLSFRFDTPPLVFAAFANNTHWPGAYVSLFDDALLDPAAALRCDGGTLGVGAWGAITWLPAAAQQYYLVADGIIPASEPGLMPEGAFSISIIHDGDLPDPSWLTSDTPIDWVDVEDALLASGIKVASVVSLRDAMTMPSGGAADARLIAAATDALTATGGEWVTELGSAGGDGFDDAVINTIGLPITDSVYDIEVMLVEDESTGIDERDFVKSLQHDDCSEGEPLECDEGDANRCLGCQVGAVTDFALSMLNDFIPPTAVSQVFDFEVVARADDLVEVERIPVRVMVPDAPSHVFDDTPESSFYRNEYDTSAICNTPDDRPKWDILEWEGTTPGDSTIVFEIRTAPTQEDLETVEPALIEIPTDTEERMLNVTDELIADGLTYGLPFIEITAVLNPTSDATATPTLEGWTFTFFCEAAE